MLSESKTIFWGRLIVDLSNLLKARQWGCGDPKDYRQITPDVCCFNRGVGPK